MRRFAVLGLLFFLCIAVAATAAVVDSGGVIVTGASRVINFDSARQRELTFSSVGLAGFSLKFYDGVNDTLTVLPGDKGWSGTFSGARVEVINPNFDTISCGWVTP